MLRRRSKSLTGSRPPASTAWRGTLYMFCLIFFNSYACAFIDLPGAQATNELPSKPSDCEPTVLRALEERLFTELKVNNDKLLSKLETLRVRNAELEARVKLLESSSSTSSDSAITAGRTTEGGHGSNTGPDLRNPSDHHHSNNDRHLQQKDAMRPLTSTLEQRVLLLEKKLITAAVDTNGTLTLSKLCIGNVCLLPNGDALQFQFQNRSTSVVLLEVNSRAGDVLRVYPRAISTAVYFFVNANSSFGMWDIKVNRPAGSLRSASIFPTASTRPFDDVIRKLSDVTLSSNGALNVGVNLCLGSVCLGGSGISSSAASTGSQLVFSSRNTSARLMELSLNDTEVLRVYPNAAASLPAYNRYFYINNRTEFGVRDTAANRPAGSLLVASVCSGASSCLATNTLVQMVQPRLPLPPPPSASSAPPAPPPAPPSPPSPFPPNPPCLNLGSQGCQYGISKKSINKTRLLSDGWTLQYSYDSGQIPSRAVDSLLSSALAQGHTRTLVACGRTGNDTLDLAAGGPTWLINTVDNKYYPPYVGSGAGRLVNGAFFYLLSNVGSYGFGVVGIVGFAESNNLCLYSIDVAGRGFTGCNDRAVDEGSRLSWFVDMKDSRQQASEGWRCGMKGSYGDTDFLYSNYIFTAP